MNKITVEENGKINFYTSGIFNESGEIVKKSDDFYMISAEDAEKLKFMMENKSILKKTVKWQEATYDFTVSDQKVFEQIEKLSNSIEKEKNKFDDKVENFKQISKSRYLNEHKRLIDFMRDYDCFQDITNKLLNKINQHNDECGFFHKKINLDEINIKKLEDCKSKLNTMLIEESL